MVPTTEINNPSISKVTVGEKQQSDLIAFVICFPAAVAFPTGNSSKNRDIIYGLFIILIIYFIYQGSLSTQKV